MFTRYITEAEELPVPLTNNRYRLRLDGLSVTDNNIVVERQRNEHGEICVALDWYAGFRLYPLALVVAHTFKPTKLPERYWNQIRVEVLDGNQENLDPANLVWRFPKELGCAEHNGFGFIPMFSRYVISREGAVFDLRRQRFLKAGYIHGYFRYTLISDLGDKCGVSRHRALGFVFLDYPTNVDELHINHKNGIRGDDRVKNLEWVTCAENVQHAVKTGLNDSIKPVMVENTLNGVVEVVNTLRSCCEKFGVTRETLSKALSQEPWFFEKWPFRFSYQNEEDRTRKDIRTTKVLVRNMRDGSIVEYDSVINCARDLGIKRRVIQSRLHCEFDRVYPDGLQIRRKKDVTSWYQPEDVELAIAKAGLLTPCVVRDCQTGEETVFDSQREFCKALRLCEAGGHVWLSYNGKRVFKTFDGRLVQVKRRSVLEDWIVPEDPEAEYDRTGLEKRVIVRDIRDGKEVGYDSAVQCAKAHQILTTSLNYRLSTRGQRLVDGRYQFKYTTEELPFKQIDYVPSRREMRSKLP